MTTRAGYGAWPELADEKAGRESKSRPSEKTRVQFDFAPKAIEQLNEIKERTGAASYAEVVRNALKLYDGLLSEIDRGSEFLIKNKDGSIASIRLFF